MTGPDRDRRAEYRAFVREHHPDRGGDPAEFAAGLEHLRAPAPPADEPRLDPPATALADQPLAVRLVVAAIRTVRRRARARPIDLERE